MPPPEQNADGRLAVLEQRVSTLETRDAVRAERDVHIDKRFDRLEELQKDTQRTLNRLGWLVIASVIGAAMAALLNGGLGVA